ncbi:MAG: hypothetical protein WA888_13805, partial [Burkholderiaceae bacterium]
MGIFTDLYDPNKPLWTGCACGRHASAAEHNAALSTSSAQPTAPATPDPLDHDNQLAACVESAILKGLFKTDTERRHFIRAV